MPYAVQGVAQTPTTTELSAGHLRRLAIAFTAVALAVALIAISTPSAALSRSKDHGGDTTKAKGDAARIVKYAKSKLGHPFRIGSEGPRYFDCSGLVYRVYQQAGLLKKIGGKRMLAASYYHYMKRRGLVSRGNPKVGDLVWWTHKGRISHMGLYIGGGRALSALINPWGVKIHHLGTIHARFLAFGHVNLDR